MRPPSNVTLRPRTILPASASGRVDVTTPSVRRASGVANTSSVGMFGTCRIPEAVSKSAARK
jgi:hypothetical protein